MQTANIDRSLADKSAIWAVSYRYEESINPATTVMTANDDPSIRLTCRVG